MQQDVNITTVQSRLYISNWQTRPCQKKLLEITRKILHTWEDNSKIIGNLCLLETLYIALIKCVRNQSIKKFAIRSDANWALRQICYQSPISNLSRQSSRKTYMIPHFANNVGNPKLNRSEYNGDAVRLYYRDQTEHD